MGSGSLTIFVTYRFELSFEYYSSMKSKKKIDIEAPDTYFTGTEGEDTIKAYFKRSKIACTSLGTSDFGEDILCDIFASSKDKNTNIRTNLTFRVQVKTSHQIKNKGYIRRITSGYAVSIQTSLLELWQKSYYPVVLVIWDISQSHGFWGIPLEEIKGQKISNKETKSIHLSKPFDRQTGANDIKNYVEEYYKKLLKLDNSNFRCYIYPLWMPQYRLITSLELLRYMPSSKHARQTAFSANHLPVFLSSYSNINFGSFLFCIEYMQAANSTDEFLSELKTYLAKFEGLVAGSTWVSFIMSPIEIVAQEAFRVVSALTDWTCISKMKTRLYADCDYNFLLSDHYFQTKKVRATSGDECYFIHDSGKFAVEMFATTWNSHAHVADQNLLQQTLSRSFCFWDMSECNEDETSQTLEWCQNQGHQITSLDDDPEIIVISHPQFSVGGFGVMLPGMVTWEHFDSLDYKSEDFFQEIPFGKMPDASLCDRLNNKYLPNYHSKYAKEIKMSYEQISMGEALRHDRRLIRFVCYIHPTVNEFNQIFEREVREIKNQLNGIFAQNSLKCIEYNGISDVILEIIPDCGMSTIDVVNSAESYFLKVVDNISKFIDSSHNMAYNVKYLLDRWVPEDLVLKS